MESSKNEGEVSRPGSSINPYHLIGLSLLVFVIAAFSLDSFDQMGKGLSAILSSSALLPTDFIAVGGIGASLLNATFTGLFSLSIAKLAKVEANGSSITTIWFSIGFSFVGKHVLSMIPLILGVWLYTRFQKVPFKNYFLIALLSSTLVPITNEFRAAAIVNSMMSTIVAILLGMLIGFLFPIISAATLKVHGGYNLYNMGFAGGIIAFFVAGFSSRFGLSIERVIVASRGNNLTLGIVMYLISVMWCLFSLLSGASIPEIVKSQKSILSHSGRLTTDYFQLYGEKTYLNMGIMGIYGTTVALLCQIPLNGVSMAGIFTLIGFGAFGKHLRNCIPVMGGVILFAHFISTPLDSPDNILAVLFCTGLAPIGGKFGWIWGIVSGVLHMGVVSHIGQVTSGLNLYNNGFSAGFVALVLVPIILAFKKNSREQEENK